MTILTTICGRGSLCHDICCQIDDNIDDNCDDKGVDYFGRQSLMTNIIQFVINL
jgi:hypothetical protein